eukprot:PITA_01619
MVKVVEPLVKVLRLVDGERMAMGFIYEAMDQAKEKIKKAYKDKVAKYGPIWAIIDERWNNQFHRPIHAVGYFLNPRATGCECNWSIIERIHTKKRNCLDQKWLNDLVYVQYNRWLKRNQLLNKSPDLDPIVLEDIDPTSDWVVENHPAEFDSDEDLDLDLQVEASLEHIVQLNADPLVPALGPTPSPPVTGASFAQPRQKRISRLSQLAAVAQPASATTSTIAVGDDDEEEPRVGLSDSDPEVEPDDLGSSSSSQ